MGADALPFRPRDRAAYLPAADALVLADLHLGRGEGAALALSPASPLLDRVTALLDWCAPTTVVLAGDVLHSFAGPSPTVERALLTLRERVAAADATLVVVRGNHDGSLSSLVEAESTVRLADGTLVCHGHERPAAAADRYLLGHEHPAVTIAGQRHPCFLYGEGVFDEADVLALPAFTPLARGTLVGDLVTHGPTAPLLDDIGAFVPVVCDPAAGEPYVFPPLAASAAHL